MKIETTKEELKQWIEDYYWMVETIKLSEHPKEYEGAAISIYGGIMVTNSKVSNPVAMQVVKRLEYGHPYLKRYRELTKLINGLKDRVKQERDQYTLKRLLEGASLSDVAREVELSVSSIFRSRNRILKDMMGGL